MKKGFTLIELLIVIGILGILAAGLLAAIDPLDQLRKGRDQTKRNISVELVNALNRYYASRGSMPWGSGGFGPSAAATNGGASGVVQTLIDANELKDTYFQGLPQSTTYYIRIYSDTSSNVYACTRQEARSVNNNSIFHNESGLIDSNPGDTCYQGTGTTACYFCAR